MICSGETSLSLLMSLASQPARGGSRITVQSGEMYSVTSSDFARMHLALLSLALFCISNERQLLIARNRQADAADASIKVEYFVGFDVRGDVFEHHFVDR